MIEEKEKTFKTKTGFCHILPDKIVLTRDGIIGDLSKVVVGNNIKQSLIIYGVIAVGLFYFAYEKYQEEKMVISIIFALLGLGVIYSIFKSRNYSATPIIERSNIKSCRLKKGIKGFTRARFEVLFEDQNNKTKKRLIILQGSMSDAQNETEKAISIMKEEGCLKIN